MSEQLDRLTAALADRYSIEWELGRGGMAVVYLAHDQKLNRQVALKVLRPELNASLGSERFLREIEIAAKLTHPNILGLHDCGEADGQLYYTMPFVEGESLRDRLSREKQLPIEDALQITKEVADALSHAHSLGIVHRDIKPENILFTAGHAVVSDFGIARAVTEAGGEALTETGLAVGTPAYMSPEQATGTKNIDARTDIYSLGCVLYEMLAGEPPYTGPTAQAMMARKLSEPLPRISVIREAVPAAVERALAKALAKTPADRFTTVGAFGERLVSASSDAQREPRRSVRLRPRVAIVGGVVVLAGAALVLKVLGGAPLALASSNVRQVTRDPGVEIDVVISPDGSEVAYSAGAGIYVRTLADIAGGAAVRLGADLPGRQYDPSWSRDGQFVRFWACTPTDECRSMEVAKSGGVPRPVTEAVPSLARSWSPQEDRVVFGRSDSIFVRWFADGREVLLTADGVDAHSFAWSPDGETIAYVQGNWLWRQSWANVGPSSIWVIRASGGAARQVAAGGHLNQSPVWLPDSRHMVFVSDRGGSREVYVVEVGSNGARSEPQAVAGGSDAHAISVAASGRRLAFSRATLRRNIWSYPIPRAGTTATGAGHPVTEGNQIVELFGLSPGGDSIAFDTNINGNQDIFKTALGTVQGIPLTRDPGDDFGPDWSPDGREIAFYSTRSGNRDIWVMAADGSHQQQVTRYEGWDSHPSWSPSGDMLVFQSRRSGRFAPWVVTRDSAGGTWSEPAQLSDLVCFYPDGWTADGRAFACETADSWALISYDGVTLLAPEPDEYGFERMGRPALGPDGTSVYFIGRPREGANAIWAMPIGGGAPRRLVTLDDRVFDLNVGADAIYVTRLEFAADIWVMDLEW